MVPTEHSQKIEREREFSLAKIEADSDKRFFHSLVALSLRNENENGKFAIFVIDGTYN